MDNSTQVVHSLRIRWNSELCVQGCSNADLAAGVRQARIPSGERSHDLPRVGGEAEAGQGGDGARHLRSSVSRALGLESSRELFARSPNLHAPRGDSSSQHQSAHRMARCYDSSHFKDKSRTLASERKAMMPIIARRPLLTSKSTESVYKTLYRVNKTFLTLYGE